MSDRITISDHRTGESLDLPVVQGTINAIDLRKLKVSEDDHGLMTYDPGFRNTASCRSQITFIDGERGILRYRGYSVEQLARRSSHLEAAYLLIHGTLPDRSQLEHWVDQIKSHSALPDEIQKLIQGFRRDAHPMTILISAVAALSASFPESRDVTNAENLELQTYRLIGMMPSIAACVLSHRLGLPYRGPDSALSYTGNLLSTRWCHGEQRSTAVPAFEQALDAIFLLHADLEQNCSANVMRNVASSHGDPYSATAAAAAALFGPLHGGANERVLQQLKKVGSKDRIPQLLQQAKSGEVRLMGFGHRVYRTFDPRSRVLKGIAEKLHAEMGETSLLDVALELERLALEDEYFVSRRLFPNVDFYSGIILDAMDFPSEVFTVLFATARTVGWMAQYRELLRDPEQSIARPRQIYTGELEREYADIADRPRG